MDLNQDFLASKLVFEEFRNDFLLIIFDKDVTNTYIVRNPFKLFN